MQCLLDMDGVLVDFIGGACKHHGIKNPYDYPANLGKYDLMELILIKPEEFWKTLDREFWANLDPMHDFDPIMQLLEIEIGLKNICLLSSPCQTEGCMEGKLDWIKKYLPDFKRRFLFGPAKHFCSRNSRLLIDDSEMNTDSYDGQSILVPRPWNRNYNCMGMTYMEGAMEAFVDDL